MAGISYGMAASRAARLRCPRCGEGALFCGLLTMHQSCGQCGFVYQRDPGYFLGSTYINYGFTSLTLTVLYIVLHFGYGLSNQLLAAPLVSYCVIVPLVMFRYARAWWLAMDCFMDTTGFQEPRPAVPAPLETPRELS